MLWACPGQCRTVELWFHTNAQKARAPAAPRTGNSAMIELEKHAATIVHACYRIYSQMGPGLLESVYKRVLIRDLTRSGLFVESEKSISFEFEGMKFRNGFKADIVVQRSIIVEVKCVAELNPAHYKQLLTYLRLTDLRLGFLLNFSSPTFKGVVKRIIN
jgi:GxxExxY protein